MSQPSAGITSAITAAARMTGASASYLTAAAQRESAFDPDARAATSSAAGLFQFIESTWLDTLSRHADRLGLEEAAKLPREDALALRFDPKTSALLAGALAADNAETLEARLGRAPSDGELYAAHVLGAGGAAKLITAVSADSNQSAAALFPAAARANHGLFHDPTGAPLSVGALKDRLTSASHAAGMQGEGGGAASALGEKPAPGFAASTPLQGLAWTRAGGPALALTPATIEILARLEPPERAESLGDS